MNRSGKLPKDRSPSSSRTPSLRGSSAAEAHRTVLRLENDDWSDDETPVQDATPMAEPSVVSSQLDMAKVAQMMKSTVRKRSPRGMFGLFNFGRSKKDKASRAGSETALQMSFLPPTTSSPTKMKKGSGTDSTSSRPFPPSFALDDSTSSQTASTSQSGTTPESSTGSAGARPLLLAQFPQSGSTGSLDTGDSVHDLKASKLTVSANLDVRTRVDMLSEGAQGLQSPTNISPSSSSSSVNIMKSGSTPKKKKGSFLKTSGPTPSIQPEEIRPKLSTQAKRNQHRRSASTTDVKQSAIFRRGTTGANDLSEPLGNQAVTEQTGTRTALQSGSLRSALTKKELKDLEKKEKKALKEAKKAQKRLSKKDKENRKKSDSKADMMQHRYTTEMTSLPGGFDPASLKTALTPVHLSERMGSPTRARPSTSTGPGDESLTSSASSAVLKVSIAAGDTSSGHLSRCFSDPTLVAPKNGGDPSPTKVLHFAGIDESLVRALSSEQLQETVSRQDKRQSFMNLQMLASGLDFGLDLSMDLGGMNLNMHSSSTGAALQRSSSMGPLSDVRHFTAESGASSLHSDQISSADDGSEDSDSSTDSDSDNDDASTTSSVLSSSYTPSLISSVDENEVELNKKALESGVQVELIRRIGKGSTGTVWFGLLDGRPVAVKQVELREVNAKRSLEVRNAIRHEVQLLQSLNCLHVVRYFGMFASKAQQQITLIMELVTGLSVTALVLERIKLSERFAAFIVHQVLLALQYLEENNILHRDLKPDNMLISESGVVKLIDFGTAAKLDFQQKRRSTVGTPWYCAPEVIRCEDYSYSADIWSLGCTLIELLTGKPPFDDLQDVACLFKMAEGQTPPLPPHVSTECTNFLKACLAPLPKDRANSTKLLDHPWITTMLSEHQSVSDTLKRTIKDILQDGSAKC